jgi:LemA protein
MSPAANKISALEIREILGSQVRGLRRLHVSLICVLATVVLAICAHVIYYYNYLTALHWNVVTAEAQVSSAIQYRRNLLPALIETVVSFVEHEDNVFNRAVDARERELTVNRDLEELKKKAQEAGGDDVPANAVLGRIMAIAEQYPALVSSEAFQLMMTEATQAEAEILERRVEYNDALNTYTTAMSMFPGNVYARVFRFPGYDYFEDSPDPEWTRVEVANWRAAGGEGDSVDATQ